MQGALQHSCWTDNYRTSLGYIVGVNTFVSSSASKYDISDPIQDATDPTLACNDDGTSGDLQLTATVAAGSSITAYWNPWPHNTGPVVSHLRAFDTWFRKADCPGYLTLADLPRTMPRNYVYRRECQYLRMGERPCTQTCDQC